MSCAWVAEAGSRKAAKVFGVLILSTTIAGEPPGVRVDGENEHALPFGSPEHEKETGFVNGA